MKKLMAMLLVLLMIPVAGLAETIGTTSQYGSDVVTAYDAVRLVAYPPEYVLEDNSRYPTSHVTFAPRDGLAPVGFDYDEADYIDLMTRTSYAYLLARDSSHEVFLKDVPDEYKLADGSDGVSMYIEPTRKRAYGMIGVDEYESTAKVVVYISSYDRYRTIAELTSLITEECARLKESVKVVDGEGYWSTGLYEAVTLTAYEYPMTATLDCADMTLYSYETGYSPAAELLFDGATEQGKLEIKLDSNSSVAYKKKDEADSVFTVTTDGGEYEAYITGEYGFHADRMLREETEDENALYLAVQVQCDDYATQETVAEYLKALEARLTIENGMDW